MYGCSHNPPNTERCQQKVYPVFGHFFLDALSSWIVKHKEPFFLLHVFFFLLFGSFFFSYLLSMNFICRTVLSDVVMFISLYKYEVKNKGERKRDDTNPMSVL